MELPAAGDLVRVPTGGPEIDGIVFDTPSDAKAVVAVIDRNKGPVLRSVDRASLVGREEAGPDDRTLQLLIRRTPPPSTGKGRSAGGTGGAHKGHTRPTGHRTTGK